jgi:hypothetical protein
MPPASAYRSTPGHGPSPAGTQRAAGQVPSCVSISTERGGTEAPFLGFEVGPYRCGKYVGAAIALAYGLELCTRKLEDRRALDELFTIVGS